jgi:hypothetical protein
MSEDPTTTDKTPYQSADEQHPADKPAAVATPVDRAKVIEIMEKWWQDTMPGSPLGRVTDAYNHVFAEFENLKDRIRKA